MRQKRTSGGDASPVKVTRPQPGVRHGGQGAVQGCGSLLDYEAAARYLCTTPRHVREPWAKRQLAAIKVGRCVRFAKSDLDPFIAVRRVDAFVDDHTLTAWGDDNLPRTNLPWARACTSSVDASPAVQLKAKLSLAGTICVHVSRHARRVIGTQ